MNENGFRFLTGKEIAWYSIPAIVSGVISYAYGEWSQALELLVIFMGADYVTGILASLKEGNGVHSPKSFWGLIKKGLMMLSVFIAHKLDLVFTGSTSVMTGSIYFWIANEGISLTENYARLGLPLPAVIKDKIAILKGKSSPGDSNHFQEEQ